jgi:hypothetical protein
MPKGDLRFDEGPASCEQAFALEPDNPLSGVQ